MDLCDDVDTHLARTIPRICATNKFDALIHGNVRRCGAGFICDMWCKLGHGFLISLPSTGCQRYYFYFMSLIKRKHNIKVIKIWCPDQEMDHFLHHLSQITPVQPCSKNSNISTLTISTIFQAVISQTIDITWYFYKCIEKLDQFYFFFFTIAPFDL